MAVLKDTWYRAQVTVFRRIRVFQRLEVGTVMLFVTVAVDINSSFTGNSPEVLDFHP